MILEVHSRRSVAVRALQLEPSDKPLAFSAELDLVAITMATEDAKHTAEQPNIGLMVKMLIGMQN
jgi:hypothetical protein